MPPANKWNATDFEIRRPKVYGYLLKDSASAGISGVVGTDWIYNAFDPAANFQNTGLGAIHQSWEVVGRCLHRSMGRYSKMTGINPTLQRKEEIVRS